MQTRMKLFVILAAIFAMTATTNAQTVALTANEKGEVNAVDLTVRTLMEQADKVIIETVQDRQLADQKVVEAADGLKKVIANDKARPVEILTAKTKYTSSIGNAISARRSAGAATHKAAMAYFDNVNAIVKAGFKLAADGYGDWQAKTLPITKFDLPSEYKTLNEEAGKALTAANEREAKLFRQFQNDFEEMQKRDRLLRERISKQ